MKTRLGYRLADNSRALRRLFDERVRGLGLTAAQARLLLSLDRHPQKNQGFYAEQLEVEPITLTRIVDRMEGAGWIERHPDAADRRARILRLTSKANKIVDRLRRAVDALMEEMLSGFSADELATLADLLDRLGANLAASRDSVETTHG